MFTLPQGRDNPGFIEAERMMRSKSRVEKVGLFRKTLREIYDEVYNQKRESIIRANIESLNQPRFIPLTNTNMNSEEITLFLVSFQLPLKIVYSPNEVSKDKVVISHTEIHN